MSWPTLIRHLEEGRDSGLHLGGQVFVSRQGTPVADFAWGESEPGQPLQADSLLPWLSSSKPLAAILLGQCFEQGELDWEHRVARFIPEFGVGGKQELTLRHLLTHTGGFRGAGRYHSGQSWQEIIAEICTMPMEEGWVPGVTAGYHIASSWFILGEVIQRVMGLTYPAAVRQRIAEPLGLRDTFCGMTPEEFDARQLRMAPMWLTEKGQQSLQPFSTREWALWCSPGGGGRGPIRELGRIYEDLLQAWLGRSARLLRSATIRNMTQRHRRGAFDITFQHRIDWGLGFIVNSMEYGPQTVPYGYGLHASPETFGHSGYQSSCGFADPAHELVVALVLNGTPGEARNSKRFRQLISAIYQDLGLASGG